MNKFKTSKFIITFFILILTIIVLVWSTSSSWFVSSSSNFLSEVGKIVSLPFRFFSEEKENALSLINTYKENETLKSSLYDMSEKSRTADTLSDENKQLRGLLELKNTDKNEIKIASEVISRTPTSWNDQLTIDKGSKDGVTENMLVVANGGLIGNVSKVSSDSSVITLLSNKKNSAKISVRIQTDSGFVYGIITGYNANKSTFVISQLNSTDNIKKGNTVVTSGLGTYNAESLSVGTVLSVSESKDQLNKEVLVQTTADLSDIRAVLLVRN